MAVDSEGILVASDVPQIEVAHDLFLGLRDAHGKAARLDPDEIHFDTLGDLHAHGAICVDVDDGYGDVV